MLLMGLCGGQGRGGWSGIKHLFVCQCLPGSLSVSGPGGNQLLETTSGWRKQGSGVCLPPGAGQWPAEAGLAQRRGQERAMHRQK